MFDAFNILNAGLSVWCDLTFTLEGNTGQRQYKNITIPDDDSYMNGPQFDVELTLGTTDPNVMIDPSASSAVVTVIDNDSMLYCCDAHTFECVNNWDCGSSIIIILYLLL